MSNKLTQEKIEEMITEILNERINVKIKDNKGGDVNPSTIKTNLGVARGTKIKDIRDIAAFDGDGTDLTDDDFEIGYSNKKGHTRNAEFKKNKAGVMPINRVYKKATDPTKAQLDAIKNKARGGGGGNQQGNQQNVSNYAGTVSDTWPHKNYRDPKTILRSDKKSYNITNTVAAALQAFNANDTAAAKDYVVWIQEQNKNRKFNISSVTQKAINQILGRTNPQNIQPNNRSGKRQLAGLVTAINKTIKADDVELQQVAGDLDLGTSRTDTSAKPADADALVTQSIKDMQNVKTAAAFEPHIINSFSLFQTGTLEGIWKEMGDVAVAIKNKNFPTGAQDALEFIAKANVVNALGGLAKKFDSSSAGFQFERFCVALFNGINAGGVQGAGDVSALLGNGVLQSTSQKFLQGSGGKNQPTPVGQGAGGSNRHKFGVKDTLEALKKAGANKANPSIIYFAAYKMGKTASAGKKTDLKTEYDTLDVYAIEITGTFTNKGVLKSVNCKGWNNGSYKDTINSTGGVTKKLNMTENDIKTMATPLAVIPLLSTPDDSNTAIAKYFADQMGDKNNGIIADLMGAVLGINQKLTNMERNTVSYNATVKKSGGDILGNKSIDYVNEISKDYIDIKTDYKSLFSDTGIAKTKRGAFAESKTQALDDLIAEVMQEIQIKRKK